MSRKIEDLHPVVAGMAKTLIHVVKEKLGIDIFITSTLRTAGEQLAYFAQNRKKLEEVNRLRRHAGLSEITQEQNKRTVTQLLTSIHEFGCALDICIDKSSAPGLQPEWDVKADINHNEIPDYEEIGKIGEATGFRWGGRFPKKDYVHFEYTGGLTLADLQAGKRPHERSDNHA